MSDIMQNTGRWFTITGIILIALGIAAVTLPFTTSITIEMLFGWILTISGIVKVIHSLRALNSGRCFLRLVSGFFYLCIGILFLIYPMQGLLTLVFILAILFMLDGIVKIAVAIQLKPLQNWGWMFANGITSFALSGIIWLGWPDSGSWVLGLLIGINLIFSGITMFMLASVAKR